MLHDSHSSLETCVCLCVHVCINTLAVVNRKAVAKTEGLKPPKLRVHGLQSLSKVNNCLTCGRGYKNDVPHGKG